jgi:glycosyltransferase involved in cell wall biosynthesis
MTTTVVSTRSTASRVAATVRSVAGSCHVLDLDGSYTSVGHERVLSARDVGLQPREVSARSVLMGADPLERWAHAALLRHVLADERAALAVRPGVLLLRDPADVLDLTGTHSVVVMARGGAVDDGLWPGLADLEERGSYSPAVVGVGGEATDVLDAWQQLAMDTGERWLDVLVSRHAHHVVREDVMVSAWSADVGLTTALAVDLSDLDASAPWLLDPRATGTPRIRLSDDPRLAELVTEFVEQISSPDTGPLVTSVGLPVEPHLAALVRSAIAAGQPFDAVPDLFDPSSADELEAWLAEPAPGAPVGRYLAEVYGARPELQAAFPSWRSGHEDALLAWADGVGRLEVATAPAPDAPAAATRTEGVNVVGYLSGELGVGESARLMLSALAAADVPHATVAVTRNLRSRQTTAYRSSTSDSLFDVTLLCVNAKETQAVSSSIPAVVKGSYRIGMWYWETQEFPRNQHKGFRHVDEVWVATDFIRTAVEPHSSVPVRTVMPPLPQPGVGIDRAAARVRLGLPDRPILLFAFDYASVAERKNPWGLVDAFESAFEAGERPLLVIKSISGDRSPAEAERLRLRVAGSPDVLLIEDYLSADDRDALMAACDCYVSLHRSEGLGLTMAEAMAMGKPVIATAYGGNVQFMTDDNSYLVPYSLTEIAPGSGPYPVGAVWADPDLSAAADAMRTVFDDLPLAAERGRRAADDLRSLHSPEVAGRAVAERLAQIRAERRGADQDAPAAPAAASSGLRGLARRVAGR